MSFCTRLLVPAISGWLLFTLACQPPPMPELQNPRDLAYPSEAILGYVGIALSETTPTYTGEVETFTVAPELPSGLLLDETSGTISGTPDSVQDAQKYTVTATNTHGSDSTDISIRVVAPPKVTQEPQAVYASKGGRALFSIAAQGLAPLSYQWYYGSILLPGKDQVSLLLENVMESDTGDYWCLVSDSTGVQDSSKIAHLYVTSQAQTPVVKVDPRGGEYIAGENALLAVSAQGTDLQYLWLKSGLPLDNQNKNQLLIDPVTSADTGCYKVVVFNSVGADTSEEACVSLIQSSYQLSITSGANGSVFVNSQTIQGQSALSISRDSSVTFFFQPDTGYRTASVVVDGADIPQALGTGSYSIAQVRANHTIEVTFEKKKLAFQISVNDTACGRIVKYPDADSVVWKDSVVVIALPGVDCYFAGWAGTVSSDRYQQDTLVFFADSAISLQANFAQAGSYPLLVTTSPEQGGTVIRDPESVSYPEDTEVKLTANPAEGFQFSGWQGDITTAADTARITMDTTHSVTAVFEKIRWAVSLNTSSTEGGRVGPVSDTTLGIGDSMNIVATPDAAKGFVFIAWRKTGGLGTAIFGDSSSATTSLSISGGAVEIAAIFEASEIFNIDAIVEPSAGGRVEIIPSKNLYAWGDSVTLTASSELGYRFNTWSGGSSSAEYEIRIMVTEDSTFTAEFQVSDAPSEQIIQPGESINALIKQISGAPGPGGIILPAEGVYYSDGLEIMGKVTIPIQRK